VYFGIGYTWKGIKVDSAILFRLLRKLAYNGYEVYVSGEEIVLRPFLERFVLKRKTGIYSS
jgi:hypothetical protein